MLPCVSSAGPASFGYFAGVIFSVIVHDIDAIGQTAPGLSEEWFEFETPSSQYDAIQTGFVLEQWEPLGPTI